MGLTGGIGSGKSLALEIFESLGALTVSADAVVHQAYELPEVRAAVVGRLGSAVLRPDGSVDRQEVAARVFSRPRDLEFLESILHPIVRRRLIHLFAAAPDGRIVVAEVPLLFEAGWQDLFDVTMALGGEAQLRYHRVEHLYDEMDFAIREALQLSDEERRRLADLYYENGGTKAELAAWVEETYGRLRDRLRVESGSGLAAPGAATETPPLAVVNVVELAATAAAGRPGSPAVVQGTLLGLPAEWEAAWQRLAPGTGVIAVGEETPGRRVLGIVMQGAGSLTTPEGQERTLVVGTVFLHPGGAPFRLRNASAEEPLVLLTLFASQKPAAEAALAGGRAPHRCI